jgi:PleD family two-component response regulator
MLCARIASGIRAYNQKVYMPESTKNWEEVVVLSRDKTKVLVVDDEQAIAEITAAMFTSEGYFVDTATNGDVAFDLYCQYLSVENLLISS